MNVPSCEASAEVKTQSGKDLDLQDGKNSEEPAINSKPTLNLHPAEVIQPRKWRKGDAATSTLQGARKVKTQSGNDLDLEDGKNSEEPAINSKPTLNLHPADEIQPRKWRKGDTATSTLLGRRVKKGHEFRGFGQQIGDGAQKRENTSDRELEARGCLGQEECNQLKSKII